MVYSFWTVFFLLLLISALKIRSTRARFLLEKAKEQTKAQEQEKADLDVRLRTIREVLTREYIQGQQEPKQGEIVDVSRMLGAQGQKGRPN